MFRRNTKPVNETTFTKKDAAADLYSKPMVHAIT